MTLDQINHNNDSINTGEDNSQRPARDNFTFPGHRAQGARGGRANGDGETVGRPEKDCRPGERGRSCIIIYIFMYVFLFLEVQHLGVGEKQQIAFRLVYC